MDTSGRHRGGKEDETILFSFSEIPDTHGAKEMFRAFQLYANVTDVVIPKKRNKWGKRFGFARFRDVVDPRMFASLSVPRRSTLTFQDFNGRNIF